MRLILEQKLTIAEAARRLSRSGLTLKHWVGRARRASARHRTKSPRVRCAGAAAWYALRRLRCVQYPLGVLCRVLEGARSGYSAGQLL